MKTNHNPVPWHFSQGRSPHHQGQVYNEVTGGTIALTFNDENAENARLIAAAPQLLASLQGLLDTALIIDAGNKNQFGKDCHGFAPDLFDNCREAIASATK